MKKKQVVSHYNYKMTLIKTSVFTYANSLSTLSFYPCHSLFFSRDHLRSLSGIIFCPGSFAVQFGDHLRSGIIYGPGIICGPVQLARPFFSRDFLSRQARRRLFTVPYFSVRSLMSVVEFDGRPPWSLDASETGESTKCPWVVAVGLIAWG